MGLDRRQLAVLHVAAKALGLDDDCYRDVLFSAAGVRSARELDLRGFRAVMRRFEELGFVNPKPRPKRRRPIGDLVSSEQQLLIKHLYEQLGMDSSARQNGFNRRQCGKPWPQTRADANRVIEGLKKMAGRGYDAGPNRT